MFQRPREGLQQEGLRAHHRPRDGGDHDRAPHQSDLAQEDATREAGEAGEGGDDVAGGRVSHVKAANPARVEQQ